MKASEDLRHGERKCFSGVRYETHKAIFQPYYIPMTDSFEDIDLALQVLEQLGREFLPADGLDRDEIARFLLVATMLGRACKCRNGEDGGITDACEACSRGRRERRGKRD